MPSSTNSSTTVLKTFRSWRTGQDSIFSKAIRKVDPYNDAAPVADQLADRDAFFEQALLVLPFGEVIYDRVGHRQRDPSSDLSRVLRRDLRSVHRA